MNDLLNSLQGGLVVSCQAPGDSPLSGPKFMSAMAQAAEQGGAVGIRADGPEDVSAISQQVNLPVIGIYKRRDLSDTVYITPDFSSARAVAQAGSDILAVDGTSRERPGSEDLGELVRKIQDELALPVMADISTPEEALNAEEKGVDLVATTLSGYTSYTEDRKNGPDLALVTELTEAVDVPVVAEGRFQAPNQVVEAFSRGAHAVVIGTAITNPVAITRKFTSRLKS